MADIFGAVLTLSTHKRTHTEFLIARERRNFQQKLGDSGLFKYEFYNTSGWNDFPGIFSAAKNGQHPRKI